MGVNVFWLWNLISDETFCTQSQIMVEKFLNFRQNLSAFGRGWQLVAVGVTWPFWIMWHQLEYRPQVQPERGQDNGQGRPCVQEENQGGHQNPLKEAWTEQRRQPGHSSCYPPTRRVMWHQRPLVAIPWWRQRDSAENFRELFHHNLTLCAECFIRKNKYIWKVTSPQTNKK